MGFDYIYSCPSRSPLLSQGNGFRKTFPSLVIYNDLCLSQTMSLSWYQS